MNDKSAIKHLEGIFKKYPLSNTEKEALKTAIGILAWTKLLEGYQKNRKKARDKKLREDDRTSFE